MNKYEDLSDTSNDEEDEYDKIINNAEIKKFCDDFIFERRNMGELDKIIFDNGIDTIFGLDKFYIGAYCQKQKHLYNKSKIETKKIEETYITINDSVTVNL
jgi:hypothetical protein